MSQNSYILFYSNKCVHSKELLVLLNKDPELDRKFKKVNIDNPGVNIPNYVTKVPSAVIPYNGKQSLFVGKSIFKWYEDNHRQTTNNQEIMDYDPIGMSGYSDSFSFIDNNNPLKKAYTYLNENFGGISNVGGGGGGGNGGGRFGDDSDAPKERESLKKKELDNALDRMMQQRNNEVPKPPQRFGGGM